MIQRHAKQLLNLRTFLFPIQQQHSQHACAAAICQSTRCATTDARVEDHPTTPPVTTRPDKGIGIMHMLKTILQSAEAPLTSDQVWEHVAKGGGRSKTHTKRILAQMKQAGQVGTRLVDGRRRKYGYYLKERGQAQLENKRRREAQAAEEQGGEQVGKSWW